MLPGKLDLAIYKGDDYELFTRLRSTNSDGTAGDYLDLTGYTIAAEIRSAEDRTSTLIATLTPTISDQTVAETVGSFFLRLDNATTSGINPTVDPNLYWWDLQLTAPDGKKRTYLKGRVTVEGDITV